MKKHLSLLMLLAALLVPWVTQAQVTLPYSTGFETGDDVSWTYVNDATNGWYVGTAAHSIGSQGLYISNNSGAANAYTVSSTQFSYAYRDFTVVNGGLVAVSFDWKANGEGNYDYLRAWIAPATVSLVAGQDPEGGTSAYNYRESTPTGWTDLGGKMNLQTSWQNTVGQTTLTPGTYRLIFMWANDASGGTTPPAAVDNVQIAELTCPRPVSLSVSNITTDGAVLTWSAGGTEGSWEVSLGDDVYYTTDTSYTFTNLDGNTPYVARVRAICGTDDTSFYSNIAFRTSCVPISTLPYSNDFEDEPAYSSGSVAYADAFPACWTRINDATGTYNYYPYINTSASYLIHGSKSMYWYHTTTSSYADNEYAVLPPVDLSVDSISDLTFAFYARTTATAAPWPLFIVGVMTNPSDATTFVPVDTITLTTTATLYAVSLANYSGTGNYIAIRCPRTSSTRYCSLDDVYLTDDWCNIPGQVTASSTSDEITISWNANGGSSFTVFCGTDTITGVSDTSYTFMGLSANTLYAYGVAAECSSSLSSFVTGSIRTQCIALTELPYSNDFENEPHYLSGTTTYAEAFPNCWTRINDATGTYNYYPYLTTTANYVHSGTKGMYWYQTSTSGYAQNEFAVLPPVDPDYITVSDLVLSFYAKTTSTSYHPAPVVGVMTDPTDASTFVPVYTFTSTEITTNWTLYTIQFSNYTGTGTYIAIKWANPGSTWYMAIDDIYLTNEWCDNPENVTASSTTEEVTLSWNTNGGTSFTVILGEDTVSGVTDSVYTFTDLTPNTPYTYGVFTECSSSSSLVITGTIRTLCVAIDSLPYTYGFEDMATGSSSVRPVIPCWKHLNNATQYFGYPYVSSTTPHSGSRNLYWYGSTTTGTYGDYQIVVLPSVDTNVYPMNTLQLRFWARPSSTSYHPVFVVGVMTDPTDVSTFYPIETVNVQNVTTWQEFTVAFGGYTGSGSFIAVRMNRPSSAYYAYTDDFTIETMPNCPAITDLNASTSAGGAILTWDWQIGYDDPGNYTVTYDSIGGSNPTTLSVTTNSVTISGLQPNTSYKAYVRANCGSDGLGRMDSIEFATSGFGCAMADTTLAFSDTIGNGTSTSNYLPSYSFYNYGLTQQIYTAAEIGHGGQIDHISFMWSTVAQQRTYEIYMAHTNVATATDFIHPADLTLVYNGGPVTLTANQWTTFNLTTPFEYNGSDNLVIILRDMTGSYVSGNYGFVHSAASGAACYVYQDSGPYDPFTFSGGTTLSVRNNIIIGGAPCAVEATCANPVVVVSGYDTSDVTISWAPGYDETSWDVYYRVAGDTTWIAEAYSTGANTYTFTGLTPATDYQFRVSFICNDGNEYEGIINFTTPCAPMPLPYTENFDNLTTGTATSNLTVRPKCWDYLLTGTSSYQAASYHPGVYYSTSYSNSGNYCYRLYGEGYHMLPEMSAPLDSLMLSFNAYITSASYGLVVGVMENGMFIPIDTMDLSVSTHNYVEMLFTNYHGNSRTIAFRNYYTTSSTTYYSYVYLDDIRVEIVPDCVRPITIDAISVLDNAFTITWDSLSQSGYDVYIDTIPVNPDTIDVANYLTAYDNNITINGLTENTVYYVYVRTNCGAAGYSDWSNVTTVRTACAPIALPYTEDFEAYNSGSANPISPCWHKHVYGTTTQYPYPYSTNAVTGQRSLYFYAYHPSSATTTPYHCYAALPMFQDSVNNLALSFKVRTYSTASNYYYTYLQVGVMDNPEDIATFTPVETINLHGEAALSVHDVEVYFNNYTGTGRYLAIYDPVPPLINGVTYAYSYAYVDDILVDTIPSCPRVHGIVVNNISQNGATVHWDASLYDGVTFDIEYGPHGFTQGTGTTLTTTDDSIDISGLNPSEQYDVYVRAHCTAVDASPWSFVYSFYSECGVFATPYFEDFESYGSGSSYTIHPCWVKGTSSSTAYPYPYSSNAINGSRSLYFYSYQPSSSSSTAIYSYAALPEFDQPVSNLEISFLMRRYSTVSNYYTSFIVVGVMTNASDITTFTPVDTIDLFSAAASSVHDITVSFSNYTGTGKYITIYAPVPPLYGTSTYTYGYTYIDDVFVGINPACPRAYNLQAYNGTANSVTLEWTDTIGSSSWVIEYGQLGDTNTTTVTVNSNPYILTGLTPGTNYHYHVAPVCSDNQISDWSRQWHNFSTALSPAAVPYSYDFEAAAEWNNWQTNSNNTVNWYRGNVAASNTTNALYLSADGGVTHSWNMNTITNAVAYRDIDFGTDTHSFQVDFDAYVGGTTSANYDGVAIVVTDPAYYVEASNSGIVSPWGNVNDVGYGTVRRDTLWGHHTIFIDGIAGVKRVAFYHFNQATGASYPYEDNPPAIDNVSIIQQPCERPYNLVAANPSMSSIDLSWHGDATATYQVAYRVQGAAASTNAYAIANGNSLTLTGLPSSTSYYWWVRKICTLTATDTLVSDFSVNGTFSTQCGVVSVADTLFEDFENITGVAYNTEGNLPTCWEGYNASNTLTPHVTNGSTYSYCISGTNAITLTSGTSTSYTGGVDNYLRLVDIIEPTNTLTIAFWMCTESSTNGFLEVGYLTGLNYATDFVAVKRINASTATLHNGNGLQTAGHGIYDTVSFDSVPAGNYPICFRWNYTTSYYSCCLDDIAVWSSNSCTAPAVSVSAITYQSANLIASGSSSYYELNYGTDAGNLTGSMTSINGIFSLTGLLPDTNYYYEVRQQCDSATFSNWTEGVFRTDSLPCTEPANLQTTATSYTSATLTWTGNANTYEVHVAGASDNITQTVVGTSATITGLHANVAYTAEVRALCLDTVIMSGWSQPLQFTTDACQPVTGFNSTTTSSTATITWTSTGSASYTVVWGYYPFNNLNDAIDQMTVTTNSCTITGLDENEDYGVFVYNNCAEGVQTLSAQYQIHTQQGGVTPTMYTINVVANNSAWGNVTGGGTYAEGASVQITATGNPGYHFDRWNDNNTDSVRTIIVTGNATYTANFVENGSQVQYYTVTVASNNEAWGTVDGGGSYAEGTTATITANPKTGYKFVQWNDGNTSNPRSFVVTADVSYTATFAVDPNGIDDVENGSFVLAPNPASSSVTLSLTGFEGIVKVEMVDMNGRVSGNWIVTDGKLTIDLAGYAQGAYFVRVTGEQQTAVRKLIVR